MKGLIGGLGRHPCGRELPQLVVDEREQVGGRLAVTGGCGIQKSRHIGHAPSVTLTADSGRRKNAKELRADLPGQAIVSDAHGADRQYMLQELADVQRRLRSQASNACNQLRWRPDIHEEASVKTGARRSRDFPDIHSASSAKAERHERVCGCSHSHRRRRNAPCRASGCNLSPALDLDVRCVSFFARVKSPLPGEAESGSAGVQPDEEYPGRRCANGASGP